MRRMLIGVGALGALLVLTAGACEDRGTIDAPIDRNLQDNQAPYIVNMPDGYMNLALKCLGDDLIVAHTRQAAPIVVADSELCGPGSQIPQVDVGVATTGERGATAAGPGRRVDVGPTRRGAPP